MDGYAFHAPRSGRTPVLVEVPHAGTAIPPALRDELIAPNELILRDADLFVDELYASAPDRGAALLCATLSRYVVDLNRAPDDVDLETVFDHPSPRRSQPRGVVWRVTADGRPLLRTPLDYRGLCQRLALYHEPYHTRLTQELARVRAEQGFVILVAAHSMPSVVKRGGRDVERRADVVPGSLGRTSAHRAIIDLVERHFRAAGLSVRHDDPYRGGYTTAYYGRPREAQHDSTRKPGDFQKLQQTVSDLVAHLGTLQAADLT
jgi:N-formylglutamate deformylase